MKTAAFGSILIALGLAIGPLSAAARERSASVAVTYADLDLRTAAGIAALDRRLERAETAMCSAREGYKDLRSRIVAKGCVQTLRTRLALRRDRAINTSAVRTALMP